MSVGGQEEALLNADGAVAGKEAGGAGEAEG